MNTYLNNKDMKIIVPKWAIGVEDEGVNVFLAFASRICDIYGYDTEYYISIDDVSRMTNKISTGIVDWLRSFPQIEDNMIVGDLLETTMIFQISTNKGYGKRVKFQRVDPLEVELKEERNRLAWIYLLGCLNNDIISENMSKQKLSKNTFGMKTFQISREASSYIKVGERKAMRDKYEELKEDE